MSKANMTYKLMNKRTNKTNKQLDGWTSKDDQTKKPKERNMEAHIFIIGGRNVVFYYRWHKRQVITGGTKVGLLV